MRKWVNGWVSECMRKWVNGDVSECMRKWVNGVGLYSRVCVRGVCMGLRVWAGIREGTCRYAQPHQCAPQSLRANTHTERLPFLCHPSLQVGISAHGDDR